LLIDVIMMSWWMLGCFFNFMCCIIWIHLKTIRNIYVHTKYMTKLYTKFDFKIWQKLQSVSLTRHWCMGRQSNMNNEIAKGYNRITRDNCARTRFFFRKAIRKTHAVPLIAEIYMPNEWSKQQLIFRKRSVLERYMIKNADSSLLLRTWCKFKSSHAINKR